MADQFYLNTSTSATVDRLQYGYDRDGNVLYELNLVNGAFSELYHANSADNNAAYDPLNRITSFSRGTLTSSGNNGSGLDTITSGNLNPVSGVPNTSSWSLDAIGNWNSSAPGGSTVTDSTNSKNEETANGSNTITYDNDGNMKTDELGNHLWYDAWNHLVWINNPGNTATLETYHYDALGRADVGVSGFRFYYSTQHQIIEEAFTTSYDQYVWGLSYVNDLILRDRDPDVNNGTGSFGKSSSGLEEREYPQHDKQFSTISLTNSSGTVTERFVYDPYGADTALTPSWTATSDGTNYFWYRFQGMRLDADGQGNLYLSQSREYDVTLGRWIGQDPAGYTNGSNVYQFVLGSPVNYVDPFGSSAISISILTTPGGSAAGGSGLLDGFAASGEAAGTVGLAVGAGAAIGAGVYYSGAGGYIGTDWVGNTLFDYFSGGDTANAYKTLNRPFIIPLHPPGAPDYRYAINADNAPAPAVPPLVLMSQKWLSGKRIYKPLADKYGVSVDAIRDAIEEAKDAIRGINPNQTNPDVEVDPQTGDIRIVGSDEPFDNIGDHISDE